MSERSTTSPSTFLDITREFLGDRCQGALEGGGVISSYTRAR